ncbi:outer membrane beta-barrel protein [Pararcticibacter amylolyticus]|uniref:Outer membrane protein beta-barrel domain-containing protein n=1 Tax=Pararcticibacter amylolyticus TaxID=2173175 RepID=A0A2U2PFY3_9SPHI|nr:outer membrane beta-barrel protein [Pararcticibacter amylolyticus]PWG80317.1 hypothetical protein DDR33_11925 [Pararcticibacter amylolyticus]
MKKVIIKASSLAFLLAGLSFGVMAQTTDQPATSRAIRLSIAPEFGLPVGNLSDSHDWSFGGSLQVDYPVAKDLFATLNAGYNNIFGKSEAGIDVTDLQLIPVKAGLKYFPTKMFYVQAEAGAAFLANKSDFVSGKSASFVYAPQVGVQLPFSDKSFLDAGIRFEGNTKFVEGGDAANFFGLRLAYSFQL